MRTLAWNLKEKIGNTFKSDARFSQSEVFKDSPAYMQKFKGEPIRLRSQNVSRQSAGLPKSENTIIHPNPNTPIIIVLLKKMCAQIH